MYRVVSFVYALGCYMIFRDVTRLRDGTEQVSAPYKGKGTGQFRSGYGTVPIGHSLSYTMVL